MNLQRDHYREAGPRAERGVIPSRPGPPGALAPRFLHLVVRPALLWRGVPRRGAARRRLDEPVPWKWRPRHAVECGKTFNNGSLGSGIDEERSEMR